MKATTRISKEERRREIIEAATHEFAISGLHGTPVDAIAGPLAGLTAVVLELRR